MMIKWSKGRFRTPKISKTSPILLRDQLNTKSLTWMKDTQAWWAVWLIKWRGEAMRRRTHPLHNLTKHDLPSCWQEGPGRPDWTPVRKRHFSIEVNISPVEMLHTSLKAVDDSKSRVKRHAIDITCMSFQALNKDILWPETIITQLLYCCILF